MPGRHQDLKRAIRAGREQQGIDSDIALSLAAGVHLQTLQNWMYGKTTPRPHELSKVAKVLDKPMDYFMAIYEGREPEPPPLIEQLGKLTTAVQDLVAEIREERAQGHDAAAAMLRAAAALGSRPMPGAETASSGPPALRGTEG